MKSAASWCARHTTFIQRGSRGLCGYFIGVSCVTVRTRQGLALKVSSGSCSAGETGELWAIHFLKQGRLFSVSCGT